MDRYCDICGHTTHDGTGKCRFCGTSFPPASDPAEPAAESQQEEEPARKTRRR